MPLTFADTAAILDAKTESELLMSVQLCTRTLGFERCLLGFELHSPLLPTQQHVLSGYPDQWQIEYHKAQYVQIDPTVSHCLTHSDPVVWHEGLFVGKDRRKEALWETARSYGLGNGLSVPIHDLNGSVSSMLSVARDKPISSGQELVEVIAGAKTIAAVAHTAASRMVLPNIDRSPPKLTKREYEILKYIIIGKNRWEISTIVGLSESAIAFHTSNLLRKFDVSNRTQLSVKAITLNLA